MELSPLIFVCILSLSIAAALPVQPEIASKSHLALDEPRNELEDVNFGDKLSPDDTDRVKRWIKWKPYRKFYPKVLYIPKATIHSDT